MGKISSGQKTICFPFRLGPYVDRISVEAVDGDQYLYAIDDLLSYYRRTSLFAKSSIINSIMAVPVGKFLEIS